MSQRLLPLFVVLLWSSVAAASEPPTAAATPEHRQIVVIHLTNLDARSVVKNLFEVLELGRADGGPINFSLTAETRTNSLLVAGPGPLIEEVRRIIRDLEAQPVREPGDQRDATAAIDVTIFQVMLPAEKLASVSSAELTAQAADAQGFAKHLATLGESRAVHRFLQRINLRTGGRFTAGASVPFLRGIQTKGQGQHSQIEYQDIGCKLDFRPNMVVSSGTGRTSLTIEVSSMTDSGIEVSSGVTGMVFNKSMLTYEGPFTSGKPIVVLAVNPAAQAKSPSAAYVARIVLNASP